LNGPLGSTLVACTGRLRIRAEVGGAVQGVGFRPFVWRLARGLGLAGWVANTGDGVRLEVEGEPASIESFLRALEAEAPPNARPRGLVTRAILATGAIGFEIRESDRSPMPRAVLLPDLATCGDCLCELFDPADRRYHYPFINCTNCGPRYSIIADLPYDRQRTSMRIFAMCPACAAEYADPASRRFHAEPNACRDCGPRLAFWDQRGNRIGEAEAGLAEGVAALRRGSIVALKGLGGFQLLVDAAQDEAVQRLRRAKGRPDKPFALMCPSLDAARELCEISALEEACLASRESPILLLARRSDSGGKTEVAASVAPGIPALGIMLPYTPLHHLLMRAFGRPLVATSGNLKDEPIATDEHDALDRLGGIADLFLVHDRPILRPVDDSVLRIVSGKPMMLRRARGYAPLPIALAGNGAPVLGFGGHMKSSVALGVDGQAFVSQHVGDLETPEAERAFQRTIADLTRIYRVRPATIAHDLHPDYVSTRHAETMAAPRIAVQHHLAHVAAVMAEHGLSSPVLGIAWDGTGYGTDGSIWGGEFLLVSEDGFRRVAHLRQFPLPGGESAMREPRRAAIGVLFEHLGPAALARDDLAPVAQFSDTERRVLAEALLRKLNTPRTSSVGRLFDAVASLTGLRQSTSYEGQAAMELEWAAREGEADAAYDFPLRESGIAPSVLDWAPALDALLADLGRGAALREMSARFHDGLIAGLLAVARRIGERQVVLAGGCFQNRRLMESAVAALRAAGFAPFWPSQVPPNDGGLCLGQVAWASRLLARGEV